MNFRQATKEDASHILELTHSAFNTYSSNVGKKVAANHETMEKVLSDIEKKYVLVAIHQGEIVGSLRCKTQGNLGYISRVCSCMNKKDLNIGHSMINYIKENLGFDCLCLHTSTKLSNLVYFYYKSGFFIYDVKHDRGYPRGFFICPLNDNPVDLSLYVE